MTADDTRSDGTVFRYDDDGTLDEIVARDVTGVHFEAMDDSAWWMLLELANGEQWHINIGAVNPNAKGYARAEQS